MNWQTKCRLIKNDSSTVVRYFDHRFQQFLNKVVKSPHKPIHQVGDYFTRLEFASRGSIHVHWFAYLENVPQYGKASNDLIATYYDEIISCSSDVQPEMKTFLDYQLHRHTKTCRIGNTGKCRFGFPIPPMKKSMILEPIQFDSKEDETHNTKNWCKIKKYLDDCHMALDTTMTYEGMLSFLQMTHEEYIKAV